MSNSFNSHAPMGNISTGKQATSSGRRFLVAIIAALAMLAVVPTLAQANVGLASTSGDRTGNLATPVDFGNTAQASLPKQITIWLYNDNNTFLSAQNSNNVFNITGTGYRRNGGSCNGAATGTSWTTTIAGSSGITGSGNSCTLILEIQAGTAVGNRTGNISFTSDRSIESGTGSRALSGNVTEENGNVIRVNGPGGETASYDFGGVAIGDSSTRTFTLRNTGTSAVAGAGRSLTTPGTSTDYSIASTTCAATLAVLSSCTVDVKYQPSAAGASARTLAFTSSSGHSASIPLTGTGFTPTADLTVTPMTFDYGNTPVGFPFGHSYTVQNTGNTTLTLNFAIDPGTDPAVYSRNVGNGTCGATLNVGNSCTYNVEFSPSAAGAAVQPGTFTVSGSTPLVPGGASKQVSVTGTRAAATSIFRVQDTAGTTNVTTHDYGSVPVNGSSSYTYTVRNTGNTPITGITRTLTGPEASEYSISATTCTSTLAREATCTITVTANPTRAGNRRAILNVIPGVSSPQATTRTVVLTTNSTGIKILNDVTDNVANTVSQKRWMESLSLAPGGTIPSDIAKVTFEVDAGTADTISGVDILGNTTTDDNVPGGTFQDIAGLSGGKVDIQRKAGSNQALVHAEVPLNSTNMGVNIGNYGLSTGTDLILGCTGGTGSNTNRRLWFRVHGSDGSTSATVGSVVRFSNQQYACPYTQGPNLSNQRVLSVGGTNLANGVTVATANKNQASVMQFNTRSYGAGAIYPSSAGTVDAVNWRIRNAKTGDMFVWNGNLNAGTGNWQACGRPCTADANFNGGGGRYNFATNATGVQQLPVPGIPSRGRWIVEGSPQGSNEQDDSMFNIGVLRINDHGNSPTLSFGGTLGARPDTDTNYTINATVADPLDPVNAFDSQGGHAQVIEWDLNGNTTDGADGQGFEVRSEGDSTTGVSASDLTQAFSTLGKTPGAYTIRARVTDNGAQLASEDVAEQKVFIFNTTINSPPVATSATINLEADDTQPHAQTFSATDADGDPYSVAITPDPSNDGSLAGNLNDVIGANTKNYTWPSTFTGSDNFSFTAKDNHNGTSPPATLTIRVRPNTTIDSSNIPTALLNPDLADPAKRFLGSTTATTANFDFSSPQHPIASYECRMLNDGDVVSDWTTCSTSTTGNVQYDDLADGLHRVEIRAINSEGDKDGTPVFRTWRVDNTSPVSEVLTGPPSNLPNQQPRFTNDNTPTYRFHATSDERSLQNYITYSCRVLFGPNDGIWIPCGAPADGDGSAPIDIVGANPDFGITDPLPDGTYAFEIQATDEVGNVGPVHHEEFIVDTGAPETALSSGPEGLINTRSLEYVLSSSQGQSTFTCKVERIENDNSLTTIFPMGPCPGPAADGSKPQFTVPTDGKYVLTAIATDPATNADPTPLVINFEVDATEPTTTLDSNHDFGNGPTTATRTQSRKVDLTFSGSDTRHLSGFQCRIDSNDDADWNLCQSIQRFSALADGSHKVEIRARDEAGNFDSTPEVFEWVIDLTPPVTTIDTAPDAVDNDATPTITFSVNEAATTECRLDAGAWSSCSSPLSVASLNGDNPLIDGPHTVNVRATDTAGNVESAVAAATWRLDSVNPEVTFTSSPNHFVPQGDVSFGWTVKDGAPPVLAPEVDDTCVLDGSPVDCDRSLDIAAPANGQHTLVVTATDEAGNVSPDASYTFEVLGSPPVAPVINNSDPADGATTRFGTARIAFSHPNENDGSFGGFECRIDTAAWAACESPYEADGLGDGAHEFDVRAHDIANNISDVSKVNWTVQQGAPVTTISNGPNGITNSASASLTFSSNKAGTFECKVDDIDWATCTSPLELTGLSEGQHTARVRAVSSVAPVGVKDPTPPARTWTVDTTPPDVAINSAPSDNTTEKTADVTFSSTDPDATFQCKVNDGLYDACDSPLHLTGIVAGQMTVLVKAIDAAGNVSGTPASAAWIVKDPTCPTGFAGTPPNCTQIPLPVGDDIKATLTEGTLSLASLGEAPLPAEQLIMNGVIAKNGDWGVPASGVNFKPIEQVVEAPGIGNVTVKISISATGPGLGKLTNGGGAATFDLPVQAKLEASLLGIPIIGPEADCYLAPIDFDLAGTYDEAGKKVTISSDGLSFPTVSPGCGALGGTVNDLLELPRDDIGLTMTFNLVKTVAPTTCPTGQTGTPPNCVTPAEKKAVLGSPVAKSKSVKAGKPVTITATVPNTGDGDASNVQVCIGLKRASKFVKGKAVRCATIASIAAGKSGVATFKVKTKPIKRKKKRLTYSVSASAAGLAKPKNYTGHVTLNR